MPENLRYDLAWHMKLLQGHGHGVSCHVAREPESLESDSEPEVVEISAEMLVDYVCAAVAVLQIAPCEHCGVYE